MKKWIFLFGCCCALAWVPGVEAASPTPGVSLKKDVEKTALDAKRLAVEKKEDYEMRIRNELEDLKTRISEQERIMRERIASGKAKMTATFQGRVEDLKRREKAVEAELGRVKTSGEAELKKLKADIGRDLGKLKEGYNDLLENLKVK
jgi:hypothetical protein